MTVIGLLGQSGVGKDTIAEFITPAHLVRRMGHWEDVRAPILETLPKTRARLASDPLRGRSVQIAMADPFKEFTREVYEFSDLQLWGPSDYRNQPDTRYPRHHDTHLLCVDPGPVHCERCNTPLDINTAAGGPCVDYLTPREALQQIGSQWGRDRWPDTWVQLALRRAAGFLSDQRIDRPEGAHTFVASWVINRTDLVVVSDLRFMNEVTAFRDAGAYVWKVTRPGVGNGAGAFAQHRSETEQQELEAEIDALVTHRIVNDAGLGDLRKQVQERLRECGA